MTSPASYSNFVPQMERFSLLHYLLAVKIRPGDHYGGVDDPAVAVSYFTLYL